MDEPREDRGRELFEGIDRGGGEPARETERLWRWIEESTLRRGWVDRREEALLRSRRGRESRLDEGVGKEEEDFVIEPCSHLDSRFFPPPPPPGLINLTRLLEIRELVRRCC